MIKRIFGFEFSLPQDEKIHVSRIVIIAKDLLEIVLTRFYLFFIYHRLFSSLSRREARERQANTTKKKYQEKVKNDFRET
ncbi:hypothetical protein ACFLRB_05390 [Acidobacteriota bacterium]